MDVESILYLVYAVYFTFYECFYMADTAIYVHFIGSYRLATDEFFQNVIFKFSNKSNFKL